MLVTAGGYISAFLSLEFCHIVVYCARTLTGGYYMGLIRFYCIMHSSQILGTGLKLWAEPHFVGLAGSYCMMCLTLNSKELGVRSVMELVTAYCIMNLHSKLWRLNAIL